MRPPTPPPRAWMTALLTALAVACGPRPSAPLAGPTQPAPNATIAAPSAVSPAPPPRARLSDDVVPTRYRLEWQLDPAQTEFRGRVTISVRVARPISSVWLHAEGLTIDAATWTASAGDANSRPQAIAPRPDAPAGLLGFDLGRAVGPGDAALHIEFHGSFDKSAGLFRQTQDGDDYVFTDFEPIDARRALPCFDDPRFKTPWDISLVVPQRMVALANTPAIRTRPAHPHVRDTDTASPPRVRVHFARTRPMPTYLVAVAVGPFEVVDAQMPGSGPKTPIRVVTPRGKAAWAKAAIATAPPLLAIVADYFGSPVPYPKLDFISVPSFNGAMENPGLITVAESILLRDPAEPSIAHQRLLALVCAHELVHMWLGNLVTMDYWNELWLNEGFASWLTDKALAAYDPQRAIATEQVESRAQAMRADSVPDAPAIRRLVHDRDGIQAAFNAITYKKGGAVTTMIERWLSEDAFRQIIRAYVAAHADGTVTTDDFAATALQVTQRDVASALRSFLDQPGAPILRVGLVCPDSRAQGPSPDPRPAVTITQSRYRPLATPPAPGADAQRWNIPMCLRYGDRRGAAHRTCTVLGHKQQTIRLDADRCPSWVMPNADGDGYYYYDMDPAELAALARAPLSPRERTDLAHDVRALLYGGQLTIDAAMPILSALSRDRGRHTTEAVIDILDTVSVHVLAPPQRANLARQIRRQYGARARLLGLTPRAGEPEEDALLRPVLIEFVGVRGADPALAIRAARRAREWLRGAADIAPELLASTLAIAAQTGDPALFDALEAALRDQPADPDAQAARRRQLAAALGAFTTPPLARRARALLIDPSLPSAVLFPVVFAQLDHPDTRGDMIKYLKDNRDALGTIPQREFLLLSFAFGPQMCSEADLDALVALAPIDITRANSVWAKRARQYLQSSRECARMRDANLAAATAHFR